VRCRGRCRQSWAWRGGPRGRNPQWRRRGLWVATSGVIVAGAIAARLVCSVLGALLLLGCVWGRIARGLVGGPFWFLLSSGRLHCGSPLCLLRPVQVITGGLRSTLSREQWQMIQGVGHVVAKLTNKWVGVDKRYIKREAGEDWGGGGFYQARGANKDGGIRKQRATEGRAQRHWSGPAPPLDRNRGSECSCSGAGTTKNN